ALILVTVIAVRFAWVFVNAYLPRALRRRESRDPFPSWKPLFLVGWTGIRGSISLVTALAIPLTLPGGTPFPSRDLIICIAFSVILATLLLQGLSLPWLIRRLDVADDGAQKREEIKARLAAQRAALARLDKLEARRQDGDDEAAALLQTLEPELITDLRN